MNFEDFKLRFLVDEDLENYMEIHNWMTGLGFPYSLEQYKELRDNSNAYNSPGLMVAIFKSISAMANTLC